MSRSTFNILFYANKSKEKNGIVPIMGRVTINGTQSQFSSKKTIPLDMWDVKGNCAKGRSKEALQINRDLDNIKAQIIKHYQRLSDREGFVTAETATLAAGCLQITHYQFRVYLYLFLSHTLSFYMISAAKLLQNRHTLVFPISQVLYPMAQTGQTEQHF